MRVSDQYDHLGASLIIQRKGNLSDEVYAILNDPNLRFDRNRPSEIKARIATSSTSLAGPTEFESLMTGT